MCLSDWARPSAYGGGSGGAGRGSPDQTTNTAGQPGIIVITYTPTTTEGGGSGITTNYAYDALGRLTCVTISDGHYTTYGLDAADNRRQVTTNTTGCVSTSRAPMAANSSATVDENSSANNIPLSLSGGAPTSVMVMVAPMNGMLLQQLLHPKRPPKSKWTLPLQPQPQ